MKKIKQLLVLLLVISFGTISIGSPVLASSKTTFGTQERQVADHSQNLEVKGENSVGEVLASAIQDENKSSEKRQQSVDNITGFEIEGNTAFVEFQTQTDAEVVVAIYDEKQLQMLASGNGLVTPEENMTEITISGDMPQYFIATAYLLDKESHKPLCDAYTIELYTKDIQDLRNSTIEDYDPEKVIQFENDNDKTNFAVFNDDTLIVDEENQGNQLTDNGDGTYTITNADSSFMQMKIGDTFSYKYEDGNVLLIKIADISVNGTTVTVWKDTDTELNDYFEYVKIESDGAQGEWSVDNENLEEGITSTGETTKSQACSVGRTRSGSSANSRFSTSYNVNQKLDDNLKITGSFKYSFSFGIDFYITSNYQYFSMKLEYSTGISVAITGKLKIKEIPLGHINIKPIPLVNVGFTPAFVVEASGKVEWSGEIKGSIGGAFDGNSGFKNLTSGPSCQSKIKVEGTLFIGIKATPYVSIISADLAKATVSFSGGLEFSAAYSLYDSSKDEIHDCNMCLKGEVKRKLTLQLAVDLVKGRVDKKCTYDLATVKIADFYYSSDYDEFGWTTCPRIYYPVKISVNDKNGNKIEGISTVTITDKKSGKSVEMRDKTSYWNSVELKDSEPTQVYLPNGVYVVYITDGNRGGEADLNVHNRKTQITVRMTEAGTVPSQKPTTVFVDSDTIQFGSYPQTKVDTESLLCKTLQGLSKTAENHIITYNGRKYYYRNYNEFYRFDAISWHRVSGDKNRSIFISEKVLDNHEYGKINDMCVAWDNADLRRWCNDDFLNLAFTEEEQRQILLNTWHSCDWGKADRIITEDKVSLPSHEMVAQLPLAEQQGVGTDYCGVGNHNYYTTCTASWFGLFNYPVWISENRELYNNYPANWSKGIRVCITLDLTSTDDMEENTETIQKAAGQSKSVEGKIAEDAFGIAEQSGASSETFSNLVPFGRYLFAVVKDAKQEDLLSASNLLYISQKDADEMGNISFYYKLRESFASPVSQVFGDCLKDIKNTEITLSETNYTYDGTPKIPTVTVKDGDYLLQNGEDYTVVYSNNVNIGTASVTISGKKDYMGSVTVSFTIQKSTKPDNVIKVSNITKDVSGKIQTVNIKATAEDGAKLTYSSNNRSVKVNARGRIKIAKKFVGKAVITITAAETANYNQTSHKITVTVRPAGTRLLKLSSVGKGKAKVTWKRNKSVTGYRIQYSVNKKFKKAVKTINISKNKTTAVTLSKLKKGKTYYVRIATYKKAGSKIYSSWSKVKKLKRK